MSVNDKWHYCHNSEVLVGSRAMRDRHLQLLGYIILQVSPKSNQNLGRVRTRTLLLSRSYYSIQLISMLRSVHVTS